MPMQFTNQVGYSVTPFASIQGNSFANWAQLLTPNVGQMIDSSNILFNSNIVMPSTNYVRVPAPVIGSDCVNKTYADANNVATNLTQFVI